MTVTRFGSLHKRNAKRVPNRFIRQRTHGINHALINAEDSDEDQGQWQADGRQDECWRVFHPIHSLFTRYAEGSGNDHEQEEGGILA